MSVSPNWSSRPANLVPADADIHVWRAFLDGEPAEAERLEGVLSDDELTRAKRLVSPADRERFISSRGVLRCILGEYLGMPAGAIRFTYERAGKPRLQGYDAGLPIRFNLSHSYGLAVYAFSLEREVGIDVEAVRPEASDQDLAERFFSASELAEFRRLPLDERSEAFFFYWTRKEAYVKAVGSGLLTNFDGAVGGREGASWTVRSFKPADGYVSAVAAEGTDVRLHFWNWGRDRFVP